jgi:hypothetical protein
MQAAQGVRLRGSADAGGGELYLHGALQARNLPEEGGEQAGLAAADSADDHGQGSRLALEIDVLHQIAMWSDQDGFAPCMRI